MYCRLLQSVPSCKKIASQLANDLLHAAKMTFPGSGYHKKIISYVGANVTSETFKEVCTKPNIQQFIMSFYHHQNIGQVETCIKFIKCTIKQCMHTNQGTNLALLQI